MRIFPDGCGNVSGLARLSNFLSMGFNRYGLVEQKRGVFDAEMAVVMLAAAARAGNAVMQLPFIDQRLAALLQFLHRRIDVTQLQRMVAGFLRIMAAAGRDI